MTAVIKEQNKYARTLFQWFWSCRYVKQISWSDRKSNYGKILPVWDHVIPGSVWPFAGGGESPSKRCRPEQLKSLQAQRKEACFPCYMGQLNETMCSQSGGYKLIVEVGAPSKAHPALQTCSCEKARQLSTPASTIRLQNSPICRNTEQLSKK